MNTKDWIQLVAAVFIAGGGGFSLRGFEVDAVAEEKYQQGAQCTTVLQIRQSEILGYRAEVVRYQNQLAERDEYIARLEKRVQESELEWSD